MSEIDKAERDYNIAADKAAGVPVSQIAKTYSVSRHYASHLATSNSSLVERRGGRPVPAGLTTRAAVAIEDALGIWPTDADKDVVEKSAVTIQQSQGGRRVIMRDIGAWLGVVAR